MIDLWNLFNKAEVSNYFSFFFSLIFTLKLGEPFRYQEIFIISLFLTVQIWILKVKSFLQF